LAFSFFANKWRQVDHRLRQIGNRIVTEQEWLGSTKLELMLAYLDGKVSERKFRLTECAFHRRFWHLLSDERSRQAVEVAERYADGAATRKELKATYAEAGKAFLHLRGSHFGDRVPHRSYFGGFVSAAQHASFSDYNRPKRFRTIQNLNWISTAAYPLDEADLELTRRAWRAFDEMHGRSVRLEELSGAFQLICDSEVTKAGRAAITAEKVAQTILLRDLFGNPFRSVPVEDSWLEWREGTVVELAQVIYDECAFDRLPILADALEDAGCTEEDIPNHCRQHVEHVRGCWVVDLLLGKE
jgi:hypothetical protein